MGYVDGNPSQNIANRDRMQGRSVPSDRARPFPIPQRQTTAVPAVTLLDDRDLSQVTRIPVARIQQLRNAGKGCPWVDVEGQPRYRWADVLTWIESLPHGAATGTRKCRHCRTATGSASE